MRKKFSFELKEDAKKLRNGNIYWSEVNRLQSGTVFFYGGVAAMALAALLGIVSAVGFRLRAGKLKNLLDAEYGKQEKKR